MRQRLLVSLVLFVLFVLFGCFGCGGATASTSETRTAVAETSAPACVGAPVRLRFAWPEGTVRVTSLERTASQAPDGSRPVEGNSEADYRMAVTRVGANTSVRFDAGARGRGRSNGLIPTFGDARITVVLAPDGAVMSVDGMEAIRAEVAAAAQSGAISADSAAGLQLSFADEGQLTNARAAWENLLSVWHGREFRCGESQSVRLHSTAHFAASMNVVETDATLRYVDEIDCPAERKPGARCVHLQMDTEADAASLRSAREAWSRALGDTASTPEARVRRRVDLIVEPDGLVPHELSMEELSELVWVAQGQRSEREIYDLSTYRFFYGAPTTSIMLGRDGAGFAVVQDGRVVSAPDTPECRALEACCSAAASSPNAGTLHLMCALARTPAATDGSRVACSAELSTVRSMLVADGVTLPQGCEP